MAIASPIRGVLHAQSPADLHGHHDLHGQPFAGQNLAGRFRHDSNDAAAAAARFYNYGPAMSCKNVSLCDVRLLTQVGKSTASLYRGGGGQVVSMLAFFSDDPSSNLAIANIFSVKFVFEKNENKQKEAGLGQFSNMFSGKSNDVFLSGITKNSKNYIFVI